MPMDFEQPNAADRDWREEVRAHGSILSRQRAEIHHPIGRTAKAKIDGVSQNIGHKFILPLAPGEHRLVDKGSAGLATLKDIYFFHKGYPDEEEQILSMSLHEFEKYLFAQLIEIVRPPFNKEVTEAILSWHR